jgi:hypothetical protein
MSTPEEKIANISYFRKRSILYLVQTCNIAGLQQPPFLARGLARQNERRACFVDAGYDHQEISDRRSSRRDLRLMRKNSVRKYPI